MATIKDVARQAEVSVSTVSRVISAHPNVKERTRERVLRVIEELDYRPSALARGLVSGTTKTLGVVVSDISNPFYPQVIRGIDDTASAAGFTLLLLNSDDDPERHARALEALRGQEVAGFILGSARLDDPSVRDLIRSGVPTVLVNRGMRRVEVSQVTVNNRRGAELATQHLLKLGHRRLLHLAGPDYAQNARDRAAGFRRAAKAAGLDEKRARVVEVGFHSVVDAEAVDQLVRELLGGPRPPTGVLTVDDVLAVRVMEVASFELGLEIPGDLAVVGFDDSFLAASRFVGLTTVSHRPYEMGTEAARALIAAIEGDGTGRPLRLALEPLLQVRRSTGAAPG